MSEIALSVLAVAVGEPDLQELLDALEELHAVRGALLATRAAAAVRRCVVDDVHYRSSRCRWDHDGGRRRRRLGHQGDDGCNLSGVGAVEIKAREGCCCCSHSLAIFSISRLAHTCRGAVLNRGCKVVLSVCVLYSLSLSVLRGAPITSGSPPRTSLSSISLLPCALSRLE